MFLLFVFRVCLVCLHAVLSVPIGALFEDGVSPGSTLECPKMGQP